VGNEGDGRKSCCRNDEKVVHGFLKADVERVRAGGG